MTLDEAIMYHGRIASIEEQACFIIPKEDGDYETHKNAAFHHKMLVKWLTELKRYREQRGINETIEKEGTDLKQ